MLKLLVAFASSSYENSTDLSTVMLGATAKPNDCLGTLLAVRIGLSESKASSFFFPLTHMRYQHMEKALNPAATATHIPIITPCRFPEGGSASLLEPEVNGR
uniref:Uncharacterized protein n=1 Tax=Opuntia streptacantha TaxID=393608 RepID=A0A7C8Z842_OPUST